MVQYTFERLSSYDFEILVRDLLQADLKLRLETFAAGPDRGIDIRYAEDVDDLLVVQCKHYARSGFRALYRKLQQEKEKVQALDPRRYILATSVRLTPERKKQIYQLLAPFTKSYEDILGCEDLNNLLAQYPEVERVHYKLWLTSAAVLNRIVHSKVFAESEYQINDIQRKLSRYVKNDSLDHALEILEENHFCVIAGVPGIGKSTLAEMLLIDFLEQGYECFRLWEDVSEGSSVLRPAQKQLFYYDDFLGKTGLKERLRKNEDERLVRFISQVAERENLRLILTTREYILNQATWIYEELDRFNLDPAKYVIDLSAYTPFIRAQILYNHLYSSNLPRAYLAALVEDNAYFRIIRHRNYNPRIIELMTRLANVQNIEPSEYADAFFDNLEHPGSLWSTIFRAHLSDSARHLLLVMASLPSYAFGIDVESAFEAFHSHRVERYNLSRNPYDFSRAMKELDGTFIRAEASSKDFVLQFQNPSIRDFLEQHLRQYQADVHDLLEVATFPTQVIKLLSFEGNSPRLSLELFHKRLAVLLEQPDISLHRSQYGWHRRNVSPLKRFLVYANLIAEYVSTPEDALSYQQLIDWLTAYLKREASNPGELAELLTLIRSGKLASVDRDHDIYRRAFEGVFDKLQGGYLTTEAFDSIVDFVERYPEAVTERQLDRLVAEFKEFMEYEIEFIQDQAEFQDQEYFYSELEYTATRLGVELQVPLEEILDDSRNTHDESTSHFERRISSTHQEDSESRIQALFDSLLRDNK